MQDSLSGRQLDLEGREVHVWRVQLNASERELTDCSSWLSKEESARAARFCFDEHRREFVLSHGVLRYLLGRFAGKRPADFHFSYGSKGKPALKDLASPIRFNMSHSGGLALYAFTLGCEIGVDVERIRPVPDMEGIAAGFFAPEEAAEIRGLAEIDRPRGFFNCWTRKEAYIKAIGEGLSVPLASLRVALRPGEPAQLLSLGGDPQAAKGWTLHHLTPATDYIGAVAYPDQPRPVCSRRLVSAQWLLAAG